ncbi:MAG: CARDB domain-containing protein [Prevotella sp.]|jgi:hypothetical protein
MEKARFLLATFLLTLGVGYASAQSTNFRSGGNKQNQTQAETDFQVRTAGGTSNGFSSVRSKVTKVASAPRKVEGDTTYVYGTLIYDSQISTSEYGIYKFGAVAGATPEPVLVTGRSATGGGCYDSDNKVYISVMSCDTLSGKSEIHVYNVQDWSEVSAKVAERVCMSSDMTYNPVDKKIYGCFYSSGSQPYQFGTLDYNTGEVTTIKEMSNYYYGMACDPNGVLYAINDAGELLKLDTSTGAETLVGSTGFSPRYTQSATFDMDTGKLYWFAQNYSSSVLYEVNPSTAATTLITDYSSRYTEVTGAFTIKQVIDDAPAKPTDLTLTCTDPELTGSLSFTMPTKTNVGADLTGSLTWVVTDNGTQIATGTADVGSSVTTGTLTFTEDAHSLAVYAVNTAGNGDKARLSHFFGNDTPMAPAGLTAVNTTSGVNITWNAVNSGVNGGYVGDVTYTVTCVNDGVVLAQNLTDTFYTDTRTIDSLAIYTYEVKAISSANKESSASVSNQVIVGSSITPPYSTDFSDKAESAFYTIKDVNGDGITWRYLRSYKWFYRGSIENNADDWVFTPLFNLTGGKYYRITFTERISPGWNTEKLEIKYGNDTTVDAMTYELMPVQAYNNEELVEHSYYLYAPTDGDYSIGMHAVSDRDQYSLFWSSFSIGEAIDENAPDSAAVKLVPAAKGGMTNTINLTLPTKTIGGSTLSSITRCVVTNVSTGTTVADVTSGLTPGASVSYTDASPLHDNNIYNTLLYNENGEGRLAVDTVWVGEDTPQPVSNVVLTQVDGNAVLTWDAPSAVGANGGYVDVENLKYMIVEQTPDVTLIADSVSGLTYTDTQWSSQTGQRLVYYGIFPENATGTGEGVASNYIICGVPYTNSFKESFANKKLSTETWGIRSISGSPYYEEVEKGSNPTLGSQDYDGGLLAYNPYSSGTTGGGEVLVFGPLVDLSTITDPALNFYYNMQGDSCSIVVSSDFGRTWKRIYDLEKTGSGWSHKSVELVGYEDSIVSFGFDCRSDESLYQILIDNITINSLYGYDMTVSNAIMPLGTVAGQKATANVELTNVGLSIADDYDVNVYYGDRLLASQNYVDEIAPDSIKSFSIEVPTVANLDSMQLTVVVDYVDDENHANDTAYAMLHLNVPKYPVPLELTGTQQGANVSLTWTRPELEGQLQVTDGAEDYQAWSIGGVDMAHNINTGYFGDFKTVDGDGAATYFIYGWPTPNHEKPMGAIILNDSTPYSEPQFRRIWRAHSGHQSFDFFGNEDGTQNDDWLILPQLGTNKSVSFYAKSVSESKYGKEVFQLMTSTTDNEISSFTAYGDPVEVATGDTSNVDFGYTLYEYNFDSDVKYVAIKYISTNQFSLFIDDISFYPAYGDYEHLELQGYNVYRNHEKVNDQLVTTESYEGLASETGEYDVWNVTAVYSLGESSYSNDYTGTTGISQTSVTGSANVYGADGSIVINGYNGPVYVYDAAGRIVANTMASGALRLNVAQGFYLVRAGSNSYKVVVK